MVGNMSLSDEKTHPLVRPLCERLIKWRREVGQNTHPHLQESLENALEEAKSADMEPELVIFVIALCEWRFRICLPSKTGLKQALMHRLNDFRYTPHPQYASEVFTTHGVPSSINEYVDRCLKKSWESEASEEMNQVFRERLLGKSKELVRELAHPFLVSEYRALPPRCGGYPDWGPWVAGTIVYRSAIRHSPTEQDSKPLRVAESVIEVLRGKRPDKSAFHRKKREIGDRAPGLFKAIIEGYRKAKAMKVSDESIQPLLDEYCFHILNAQAAQSLLVGKTANIRQRSEAT